MRPAHPLTLAGLAGMEMDLPRAIQYGCGVVGKRLGRPLTDEEQQDVRVATWEAWRSWCPDGGRNIRSWISHTVGWRVADLCRERDGRAGPGRGQILVTGAAVPVAALGWTLWGAVCPDHADDVAEAVDRARAVCDALDRALAALTVRERHVVVEHDLRARTLRAVGADLGVTESRVCQIRRQALARMRDTVEAAA